MNYKKAYLYLFNKFTDLIGVLGTTREEMEDLSPEEARQHTINTLNGLVFILLHIQKEAEQIAILGIEK